jgi:GTP-binding protein
MFNFYRVDDDFMLVDVPGLGYARASHTHRDRWERDLATYVRSRDGLALVLLLMDARHAPTATDLELMRFSKEAGRNVIVVLTKTDKLSGNGRAKTRRAVEAAMAGLLVEWPVVETSANTGRGRDELFEWIDSIVAVKPGTSKNQGDR